MKTLLLFLTLAASCFAAEVMIKGGPGYIVPATAGTDYLAATSGSAMQKANGAGGLTAAVSGDFASPIRTLVPILGNAIATSGSPADLQTVTLSYPTGYTRFAVLGVYAYSSAASGSLAIGTIDVRTATGGGGASLLNAPTALTALSAVNLVQSITPVAVGVTYNSATVTTRQTVNSLNAGTAAVMLDILFLP